MKKTLTLLILIQAFFVGNATAQKSDSTLSGDTRKIETIVVTGQFSPQSLRNSVYKARVIDREQIARKGAQDVPSLLTNEIGVRLSNEMTLGETDVELMGMSGNNVKVLIDGVPVADRGSNKQSLGQIDINTVDRVEIVEGPMSVVYGTDALAGVINIITSKPQITNGENHWSIGASVHEESAGDEYEFFEGLGIHRESLRFGWSGKSGLYASAGGSRRTSGGWKGDETGHELTWMPKDQYMFDATAGYARGRLDLRYRFTLLDEKLSSPADMPDNILSDKRYLTDRMNHQLHARIEAGRRVNVDAAVSYQDYERRTRTTLINTSTGDKHLSSEASDQDTSKMRSFFARATATWSLSSSLTLQPGADFQWDQGSGDRIKGRPSITDLAVYISAEWKATRWLALRPGLRAIVNSGYDSPPAIPSLQSKIALGDKIDMRLAYGYGFRAPKLRELYFSYHNSNHNFEGNPDLKAESSNNLSASVAWHIMDGGELSITSTLGGFYGAFRNKIEAAIVDYSARPVLITYANISRYKTLGITIENTLRWENLNANLNFALIGRNNGPEGMQMPGSNHKIEYRYSPEVSASVSYLFKRSGTGLNLYYKFNGKSQSYYATRTGIELGELSSYSWADFTVSQRAGKLLTVIAGIKNIFDVTMVENTAGAGSAAAPGGIGGPTGMGGTGGTSFIGCGRSYFVGVSFSLAR